MIEDNEGSPRGPPVSFPRIEPPLLGLTGRTAHRSAWIVVGVTVALLVGHAVIGYLSGTAFSSPTDTVYAFGLVLLTSAFAFPGAFIVGRQPRNMIGWLLLAFPLIVNFTLFIGDYATYSLVTRPGALPAGRLAAWVDRWDGVPALAVFIPVFLLFPDGRVPSARWRPALWVAVGAPVVAAVAFALTPGRMTGFTADLEKVRVENPLGIDALSGFLKALGVVAAVATLVAAFLAGASLVFRFRARRGDEREQVKWLAFVGIAFIVEFVVAVVFGNVEGVGNFLFGLMLFTLVLGIPGACAVAILKYRLYDIDVVINKTLVFAALAAFITAVYVGIVVGIGAALGRGRQENLALSIIATAVVALLFQPVRERVQRVANRLVYGTRATPYEVLSEFSQRMAGAYETADVLPRMARILAEGTGAANAAVWLRVGDELRPEATWPADAEGLRPARLDGDGPFALAGATATYPVNHRGELLGALSLSKPPGERLTPAEDELASDLASGAGLVVRNVRLTEELLERLAELQASRQRIVAAQDEERRRLERNIHDGAQQQLVALSVRARLAEQLLARDPERARAMLEQVEGDLGAALSDLRDLARGIYPPLLADKGLVAALEAQARRAPVTVAVRAEDLHRYPPDVEAAVYFSALEALQNVAKYAEASGAIVSIRNLEGQLLFEVRDDGKGFDPSGTSYGTGLHGMADRLAAVGGELTIDSQPGGGTTVTGRVPVAPADGPALTRSDRPVEAFEGATPAATLR
jgi:signal transduction histidine kinase